MASVPYVKIEPQPPEVSAAAFARAQREAEFWQAHRSEYTERFPDEHIAVAEDGRDVSIEVRHLSYFNHTLALEGAPISFSKFVQAGNEKVVSSATDSDALGLSRPADGAS